MLGRSDMEGEYALLTISVSQIWYGCRMDLNATPYVCWGRPGGQPLGGSEVVSEFRFQR